MLSIISPAKNLNFSQLTSNKEKYNFTQIIFKSEVKELIAELQKLNILEISKMMAISDKLAQLNFDRIHNFQENFNLENSKPAILAFAGDVYEAMAINKIADDILPNFLDFAQNNIRILSGLYGILKPLDLIQPYRLEMSTNFNNSKIFKNNQLSQNFSNLYSFWNDKITDILNYEIINHKDKTIVNLASEEYFRAINLKKINAKILNIIFKEQKNDQIKIIGISAKKARGLMARFIIDNKINNHKEIINFKLNGYCFNKDLSNNNNYIFVRNIN